MKRCIIEENILLVKKPFGISSFDVIRLLRNRLKIKKIGHAGTLDPMAEGLLIVGIGAGTKKLGSFLKLPKTYEATVILGKSTDTGDITGKILEERAAADVSGEKIVMAVLSLRGKLLLPVPAYSAVNISGKRLYALARAGEKVVPPVREMEIKEISLKNWRQAGGCFEADVTLRVSSGTYIRSIAVELGKRLGVPATLKKLTRTSIGDYSLKDAAEVGELSAFDFTSATERKPASVPKIIPPKIS